MKRFLLPFVLLGLTSGLTACTEIKNQVDGCASTYRRPDTTLLLSELQAARAKWASQGLHSYTFDYTRVYPAFAPIHVTVKDDVFQSATFQSSGQVQDAPAGTLWAKTIPELFDSIERSITAPGKCEDVGFKYDAARGYPTEGRFAYLPDPIPVGASSTWQLENVQPLTP